jgi:hypothetical protein
MIEKASELRKRRSIRKRNLADTLLFNYTNYVPILVIVAALGLGAYCATCFYVGDQLSIGMIALAVVVLGAGLWMLYAVLFINVPLRKSGLDEEKNKALIDGLLREQYRDFHFHLRETELLCIRLWTLEKPGKEIRVDFRNNDVLVNIKTYLMYGHVQSHYHVLANQKETLEVLRLFRDRTRSVAA